MTIVRIHLVVCLMVAAPTHSRAQVSQFNETTDTRRAVTNPSEIRAAIQFRPRAGFQYEDRVIKPLETDPVCPEGLNGSPSSFRSEDRVKQLKKVAQFGADDRLPVSRDPGSPFSPVVLVQDPETNATGTGFFIKGCRIVTVAHNFPSARDAKGVMNHDVRIYAGDSQGEKNRPYRDYYTGKVIAVGKGYVHQSDAYAQEVTVIQLPPEQCTGQADRYGYFEPSELSMKEIIKRRSPVILAGHYPDRPKTSAWADPTCMVRGVHDVKSPGIYGHDCTAQRGTSGAPLLTKGADGKLRYVGMSLMGISGVTEPFTEDQFDLTRANGAIGFDAIVPLTRSSESKKAP